MSSKRFPIGTDVTTYNGFEATVVDRRHGEAMLQQRPTGLSLGWWKLFDLLETNLPKDPR